MSILQVLKPTQIFNKYNDESRTVKLRFCRLRYLTRIYHRKNYNLIMPIFRIVLKSHDSPQTFEHKSQLFFVRIDWVVIFWIVFLVAFPCVPYLVTYVDKLVYNSLLKKPCLDLVTLHWVQRTEVHRCLNYLKIRNVCLHAVSDALPEHWVVVLILSGNVHELL